MNDQPNKFSDLIKDSLVQIAKEIITPSIESNGGNIERFDFSIYQIRVFVNEQYQWVHFNLPIKYLPCNTSYYGNMSVELLSGSVSFQQISNPKKSNKEPVFYETSAQAKKVISFVISALNKNEPNTIDSFSFNNEMIIADQEHFYWVTIQSDYFYSDYKIEKGTGIILMQEHEELIPMPEEVEEKLVEIK
jgi:hypothetical protein